MENQEHLADAERVAVVIWPRGTDPADWKRAADVLHGAALMAHGPASEALAFLSDVAEVRALDAIGRQQ